MSRSNSDPGPSTSNSTPKSDPDPPIPIPQPRFPVQVNLSANTLPSQETNMSMMTVTRAATSDQMTEMSFEPAASIQKPRRLSVQVQFVDNVPVPVGGREGGGSTSSSSGSGENKISKWLLWNENDMNKKLQKMLKHENEPKRAISEMGVRGALSMHWLDMKVSELKSVRNVHDIRVKLKSFNICCKGKTGTLLDLCYIMGFVQIGMAVVAIVGKLMSFISFTQSARSSISTSLFHDNKIFSIHLLIAEGVSFLLFLLSGLCIIVGVSFRKKWIVLIYIITCGITELLLITMLIFQAAVDKSPQYRQTFRGPLWITVSLILLLVDIILITYSTHLFFALDDFLLRMQYLDDDDALIHDSLSTTRVRTLHTPTPSKLRVSFSGLSSPTSSDKGLGWSNSVEGSRISLSGKGKEKVKKYNAKKSVRLLREKFDFPDNPQNANDKHHA